MFQEELDSERDGAAEQLANAYAYDLISMEQLETRLAEVAGAGSVEAVRKTLEGIPRVAVQQRGTTPTLPERQQLLRGSAHSLRKEGQWVRSRRVVIVQSASSIRLDLSQLAEHPGQVFELELALKACSCRIRVPRGTRVEERLELHHGSYRCSRSLRRNEDPRAAAILISGRAAASSVRVKPSRRMRKRRR